MIKSPMPEYRQQLKNSRLRSTGKHSLVYTWGITGIVYNKNFIKEAPTSWEDLWNPDYKGRVILLNDNREVIGMALKKTAIPTIPLTRLRSKKLLMT